MTKHDKLIKEIYKTNKEAEGLDIRVVDKICRDPLNFTANVFRDPLDYRPVMIRYWGKFVVLTGAEKRKADE